MWFIIGQKAEPHSLGCATCRDTPQSFPYKIYKEGAICRHLQSYTCTMLRYNYNAMSMVSWGRNMPWCGLLETNMQFPSPDSAAVSTLRPNDFATHCFFVCLYAALHKRVARNCKKKACWRARRILGEKILVKKGVCKHFEVSKLSE